MVLPLRRVALAVVVTVAACGSETETPGDVTADSRPGPATAPVTTVPAGPRAAPRWETVTTLSGTGSRDGLDFAILPSAIQWRVRWSCQTGRLRLTTAPPPRKGGPILEAGCPGEGQAYAIHTGPIRLRVETAGGWKAVIDQQVDTPLEEPPLPEAVSAPVLAQGTFYAVEREGGGTASLLRLGDGRRILRLEGFQVSQNTDLFVWLSEAARPRTSAEGVAAPHVSIGNLKSTLGSQNYEVPADLPTERIRSVVIWCEPVAIAYVAAALEA